MKPKTTVFIIVNFLIVTGLIELCLTSILWSYAGRSVDKMLLVNKKSDNPKEHFDGALKLLIALIAMSIAGATVRCISIVVVIWNDFIKTCLPIFLVNVGFAVLYIGFLLAVIFTRGKPPNSKIRENDSYYLMPLILIGCDAALYCFSFLCYAFLCFNPVYDNREKFSYIGQWKELIPQRSTSQSESGSTSPRSHRKSKESPKTKSNKSESEDKNQDDSEIPINKKSSTKNRLKEERKSKEKHPPKVKQEKRKSKSDDSEEKSVRKKEAQSEKSRESKLKRKRASDAARLEIEKSKSELDNEQAVPKELTRALKSLAKSKDKAKRVSDLAKVEPDKTRSETRDEKSTNEKSEFKNVIFA